MVNPAPDVYTHAHPDGTVTIRTTRETNTGFTVIEKHLTADAADELAHRLTHTANLARHLHAQTTPAR